MPPFVNTAFKLLCLAVYAGALAKLAGLLPAEAFNRLPMVAGALLLIHALEVLLVFKHVRLYRGPLLASVGLTLLFGLLHWKPLADAQARGGKQG